MLAWPSRAMEPQNDLNIVLRDYQNAQASGTHQTDDSCRPVFRHSRESGGSEPHAVSAALDTRFRGCNPIPTKLKFDGHR